MYICFLKKLGTYRYLYGIIYSQGYGSILFFFFGSFVRSMFWEITYVFLFNVCLFRFFKANIKIDNSDNRAIEETRREIAEAEKKLSILRHDKLVLTANLDLLDMTICLKQKPNSGVGSTTDDYAEDDDEMISETLSHSEHV